ncbi:MAG: glutamate--cysteine ligase [Pelagibacteraceae bacterium]
MLTKENLISYFVDGEKDSNSLKIGTEHEKFLFDINTKKPIDFSEKGIQGIFNILKENNWNEIKEGSNIIGLKKKNLSITLEPGLQIELSGAPCDNIHETCQEVNLYLKELKQACSKLNIGILGIGLIPNAKFNEINQLEKKRYKIMRNYMPKVGNLGLDMMHRTAATQVNFDFISEEDFRKKTKVSSCLVPIAVSLFSNSPILEGKINGFIGYRTKIWQHTDPDRSGLIPFFFDKENSYEQYCDFALNVPMYFANLNNKIVDCSGKNFNDFINGELKEVNNEFAKIEDWENHLSTIFTEVRLKQYLEIRPADSCSWSGICSIPAFWTGILYDQNTLDQCYDIFKDWKFEDVNLAYIDVAKNGFNAKLYDKYIYEHAHFFLNLSRKGLEKRNKLNSNNDNESFFLDELDNFVSNKKNLSNILIEEFEKKYKNNINLIFDEKAY